MKWKQTEKSDELSVWVAGDYRVTGTGRWVGKKLVRDWSVLFRGGVIADRIARLAEAKQWAQNHADQLAEQNAELL